ncbi:MAG: hypothetical protein FK734_01665 [Asgard group archaeon]|nr:hypothetical protein [Asgard group archaeon]
MTPNYLEIYSKEYNGLSDYYLPIFELINTNYHPQNVLYPGSYCHITPSLFYPRVVYVDNFKKIKQFFHDKDVLAFVQENKIYEQEANIKFLFTDYRSSIDEPTASFDLLISLNAGLISQACKNYLKKGALFLVNDEHYDARTAFVDNYFQFIAVYNKASKSFNFSESNLQNYFKLSNGLEMTQEMIDTSLTKSPSKDPYKPKITAVFYLFAKK